MLVGLAIASVQFTGAEDWALVRVFGDASTYDLRFIEVEAMHQVVTASKMPKAISEEGLIAPYST